MILPIYVYGEPILREKTEDVPENTPALQELIEDLIETMHGAAGIGLAAPQVGRRERIFVIDLTPFEEDFQKEGLDLPPQPMVFVNPHIVEEGEDDCEFEEGCLSIPDLREAVIRPDEVRMRYLDRNFEPRELHAIGLLARVVQHEYDHLEGILFIDRISPIRRRLLRRRLREMAQGLVEADYPLANGSS
ncbi:MAG TPA: peptide deformylase [Rhodothermales bacterium]|nr:peptide deformylase [Rhodothermales bacterium]